MRIIFLVSAFLAASISWADTPPPGTVKAKTYSGDGLTPITATGGALDVSISGASGSITANQGTSGTDPWYVSVRNNAPLPVNACQETGGNLAEIVSELAGPLAVTGTFWQTTQPVSAAALPLPSGASTAAKQPALGTAGSASSDVITVQGHSGMVPIQVDASSVAVTVNQGTPGPLASPWPVTIVALPSPVPVAQSGSWTVTANAGTGTFTVDGSGHTQPVSGTFWQATQPVSGTFWQTTQPVSAASLPLPTGAATAAKQPALGTAGSASADVITVQGVTSMTALKTDGSATTQPVSGTVTANAGTGTFAVSAASLPLPSGASTAAKQPAIGTAGTASSDVLTVQGISSMTALKVDGSAVTQPVSMASPLPAGTNLLGKVGIDQTTPGTTNGVQVNAALPAGTNLIGKVSIDQTTPGTTNLVALAANQSVNVAQINGITPLMGNGVTGTGSQRVTIASDNTAFSVNAIPKTPTAVTVKQAAVTIGTSAIRLTNDGLVPPSTRVLLVAQLLSTSTAACFFGSSSVANSGASRGVQMFAGQSFSFSNDAGDYYAICDASSQTFLITEQE